MDASNVFTVVTDPKRYEEISKGQDIHIAFNMEKDILKLLDKPGNPVIGKDKKDLGTWNPDLQIRLTGHIRTLMDREGVVTREYALVDLLKKALPNSTNDEVLQWALKDTGSKVEVLKKMLKPVPKKASAPPPEPVYEICEDEPEEFLEIPEVKPTPLYKGPTARKTPRAIQTPSHSSQIPATVVGPTGTMRIPVEEVIYTEQFIVMVQQTENPYSFWIPPMDDTILWDIRYKDDSARGIYSGIYYDVSTTGTTHFIFLISE